MGEHPEATAVIQIQVNGRFHEWRGKKITHEDVAAIACWPGAPGCTIFWRPYDRKAVDGGELAPGKAIPATEGMVFRVVRR
jgi:Multiubiquitin